MKHNNTTIGQCQQTALSAYRDPIVRLPQMHEDLIRARLDRNTQYKPGKALKIFYTSSNEYNIQIGVHHFDRLNNTTKTSCVVFFPRLKFARL